MSKYYSNTIRIISTITLIAFVCTQTALGYEGNLRQLEPDKSPSGPALARALGGEFKQVEPADVAFTPAAGKAEAAAKRFAKKPLSAEFLDVLSSAIFGFGPIVIKYVNNIANLSNFWVTISTATTFFLGVFTAVFVLSCIKRAQNFTIAKLLKNIDWKTRGYLALMPMANAVSGWFFFFMLINLDVVTGSIIMALSTVFNFIFSGFILGEPVSIKKGSPGRLIWASFGLIIIGAAMTSLYDISVGGFSGLVTKSLGIGVLSGLFAALREVSAKRIIRDYQGRHPEEQKDTNLALAITRSSYIFAFTISLLVGFVRCLIAPGVSLSLNNLVFLHWFMVIPGVIYGLAYSLRYIAMSRGMQASRDALIQRMSSVFTASYKFVGFQVFGTGTCPSWIQIPAAGLVIMGSYLAAKSGNKKPRDGFGVEARAVPDVKLEPSPTATSASESEPAQAAGGETLARADGKGREMVEAGAIGSANQKLIDELKGPVPLTLSDLIGDTFDEVLIKFPDLKGPYKQKSRPILRDLMKQRITGQIDRYPLHIADIEVGSNGKVTSRYPQANINAQLMIQIAVEKAGFVLDETLGQKANQSWLNDPKTGLRLISIRFSSSAQKAIAFAYPEDIFDPNNSHKPHKFHPWDWHTNKWSDDLIRAAVRHCVEDDAGWAVDNELGQKATVRWFRSVGLNGLLTIRGFGGSPKKLLEFVYPEKNLESYKTPPNPYNIFIQQLSNHIDNPGQHKAPYIFVDAVPIGKIYDNQRHFLEFKIGEGKRGFSLDLRPLRDEYNLPRDSSNVVSLMLTPIAVSRNKRMVLLEATPTALLDDKGERVNIGGDSAWNIYKLTHRPRVAIFFDQRGASIRMARTLTAIDYLVYIIRYGFDPRLFYGHAIEVEAPGSRAPIMLGGLDNFEPLMVSGLQRLPKGSKVRAKMLGLRPVQEERSLILEVEAVHIPESKEIVYRDLEKGFIVLSMSGNNALRVVPTRIRQYVTLKEKDREDVLSVSKQELLSGKIIGHSSSHTVCMNNDFEVVYDGKDDTFYVNQRSRRLLTEYVLTYEVDKVTVEKIKYGFSYPAYSEHQQYLDFFNYMKQIGFDTYNVDAAEGDVILPQPDIKMNYLNRHRIEEKPHKIEVNLVSGSGNQLLFSTSAASLPLACQLKPVIFDFRDKSAVFEIRSAFTDMEQIRRLPAATRKLLGIFGKIRPPDETVVSVSAKFDGERWVISGSKTRRSVTNNPELWSYISAILQRDDVLSMTDITAAELLNSDPYISQHCGDSKEYLPINGSRVNWMRRLLGVNQPVRQARTGLINAKDMAVVMRHLEYALESPEVVSSEMLLEIINASLHNSHLEKRDIFYLTARLRKEQRERLLQSAIDLDQAGITEKIDARYGIFNEALGVFERRRPAAITDKDMEILGRVKFFLEKRERVLQELTEGERLRYDIAVRRSADKPSLLKPWQQRVYNLSRIRSCIDRVDKLLVETIAAPGGETQDEVYGNSVGTVSNDAKRSLRIEKLDKYQPVPVGRPLQFIGRHDKETYELRVLPARSGNGNARDVEIVNLHIDKEGAPHLILAGFIRDLTIQDGRIKFEGMAIPDYRRIKGIIEARDVDGSFESKIKMVLQEIQGACPSVACDIILAHYWADSWAAVLNKNPEELLEEQINSGKSYNSGEVFMAFMEFLSSFMPQTAELEWNSPNMLTRGQLHLEGDPAKSSMARMTEVYGFATHAARIDGMPALVFKKRSVRFAPKPPILVPVKWKHPDHLGPYLVREPVSTFEAVTHSPARAAGSETFARADGKGQDIHLLQEIGDIFDATELFRSVGKSVLVAVIIDEDDNYRQKIRKELENYWGFNGVIDAPNSYLADKRLSWFEHVSDAEVISLLVIDNTKNKTSNILLDNRILEKGIIPVFINQGEDINEAVRGYMMRLKSA